MSASNEEDDPDAGYVCSLDDHSMKIAKEEIFEDPKERLGAVKALRKWVLEQEWLKSPTDSAFLLPFLRSRKFSQLGAREVLTNFWTVRTEMPQWFRDIDTTNQSWQEFMDLGAYLILPGRDSNGRKIILSRVSVLDADTVKMKWGYDLVYAHMLLQICVALMDENVQVNGLIFLVDGSHGNKANAIFSLEYVKKINHYSQSAVPARYKGVHLYNQNPILQAVTTAMKPFMKEKLRNRLFVHGNSLVPVYDHIEKKMLPREYLPDDYVGPCAGSVKDITEYNKNHLTKPEVLEYIKKISSPEYGVDLKLKPAKNDIPTESFRKLHVE